MSRLTKEYKQIYNAVAKAQGEISPEINSRSDVLWYQLGLSQVKHEITAKLGSLSTVGFGGIGVGTLFAYTEKPASIMVQVAVASLSVAAVLGTVAVNSARVYMKRKDQQDVIAGFRKNYYDQNRRRNER